ncbi:insulinase family protein [Sporolactobacillus pectinivorans]|uniref:insulinase family protein n=1 Tax=Sporolactobacillus pectinivorans TaxID=1591408 RepID=UPI000C262B56|nr:insulinase family protein [Sporolactobacillus pectinivorans]
MGNYQLNNIYHGFKFIHTEEVKDVSSTAFLFEHVKSGAKLLFLKNEDDNKVFSISFRTPPEDNTGVFHILEHSVLCGSDKYPVKEPFVELLKGSLSTFLNAFTFSDKTMYPLASKNDKDFRNLIDVYLDAVFHPNIYKYKEILEQEGWHYELNEVKDDINLKGVVYNEMKGAFSSPEGLLMRANQNSLYPDTAYGFESGGDPLYIPDLTYEHFIDSHKKYYSPANSYIYLYGNLDIDEKLAYLDEKYLNAYDRIDVDSSIEPQAPIGKKETVRAYPILPGEDDQDKTYLSLNYAVSKATDPETYLAFDILDYLLLDSPAAPLKKAILDAGIGRDVFGSYDNSILQPYFSVNVKNSNESQKDAFKKVVSDTLNQLVKKGIDKKQIEAAINVKEFQLREADYGSMPKGLIYSITVMDSWLYGGDPLTHLRFEKTLATIKQALTGNYFETLIEKYLLNSDHESLVVVKPSKTLADEEARTVAEKLAKFKQSLDSESLNQLVTSTKKLQERQASEDRSEDLRTIPLLSLDDIDKKTEELPLSEIDLDGAKTLYHELPTNKIAYLSLYFDTAALAEDQIPWIALLKELLGKIDTAKYSYESLVNEVNIQTGDVHFETNVISDKDNDDVYTTQFSVKAKILQDKLPAAFDLIHEILYNSRFDNKERLKAIIKEIKSRMEIAFNQSGQSVAVRRVGAYFSKSAAYKERLRGLTFYQFIRSLDQNFDESYAKAADTLRALTGALFSKDRLVIGLTGDREIFDRVHAQFGKLGLTSYSDAPAAAQPVALIPSRNEGLMTSSKIQYAAKGANFKQLGFTYTGQLLVLKQILTLDYLWNRVRVMGGAYGCGVSAESSGNFIFWSYRDPNLRETLKIYDEAAGFASSFKADEFSMTKYIIGTIANLDSPLTPSTKGELSDERYFAHVAEKDVQRIREEVLAAKPTDIQQFATLLKAITDQNHICVFGNESKIKENKDLFDECVDAFD